MPARQARELHAERGLSDREWLLMDGLHEYVTYTSAREVVAWDIEDGLQTRFPTLESFFDLAAEAWEVGIFAWQEDVEEDFGGLIACDRPRLEVLISERPEILRHPVG